MSESTADAPADCWVAFGYQNHLVPVHDSRRAGTELIGVCGVMTEATGTAAPDERPTCSVCARAVRCDAYRTAG